MENVFKEKIVIEGVTPERALSRLVKAGICVFQVKKSKKNRILLTVRKKDSEKVFAIYPNMCYNISRSSVYSTRKAGKTGVYKLVSFFVKRVGFVLGVAVYFTAVALSQNLVLGVKVVGDKSYRSEVVETLRKNGVNYYGVYKSGKENSVCADLMQLKEVTFVSVKKSGYRVRVEVRTSSLSTELPKPGDMRSDRDGSLIELTVLKGTPLKKVGDRIRAGESLVGGYTLSASGEKREVYPVAKAVLLCVFQAEIVAESKEQALSSLPLFVDGKVVKAEAEETENGFWVRAEYEYTQSVNF